jgi:1,4-alpha-glucan branching enzyme
LFWNNPDARPFPSPCIKVETVHSPAKSPKLVPAIITAIDSMDTISIPIPRPVFSRMVSMDLLKLSIPAHSRGRMSGVPEEDLILYELHVGTFSPEGTYEGVIRRLPHLVDLGVTAIELMPLADFPGLRNWGYDGVCPFAPARCYGSMGRRMNSVN